MNYTDHAFIKNGSFGGVFTTYGISQLYPHSSLQQEEGILGAVMSDDHTARLHTDYQHSNSEPQGLIVELFAYFSKLYTIFIIAFGLIGNCVSIIVLETSKRLRRLRISGFMMGLAVSDIGFLTTLSLILLQSFGLPWASVPGTCKVAYYIWYSTTFLSGWYILTMAVERFLVVYRPFRSIQVHRRPYQTFPVLLVTLLALLVNLWVPIVFQQQAIRLKTADEDKVYFCGVNEAYMGIFEKMEYFDTLVSFTVPLIVVILLNILIIFKLSYAAKERQKIATAGQDNTGRKKRKYPTTTRNRNPSECSALLSAASKTVTVHKSSTESDASVASESEHKGSQTPAPAASSYSKLRRKAGRSEEREEKQNMVAQRALFTLYNGGNRPRNSDFSTVKTHHRNSESSVAVPATTKRCSRRTVSLIPLSTGSTTNSTRTNSSHNNRSDIRTTVILVSISLSYSILNLPSYVMRLMAFRATNVTEWSFIGQHTAQMMFYTQFSVNFLLYSFHWIREYRYWKQHRSNVGNTNNSNNNNNNRDNSMAARTMNSPIIRLNSFQDSNFSFVTNTNNGNNGNQHDKWFQRTDSPLVTGNNSQQLTNNLNKRYYYAANSCSSSTSSPRRYCKNRAQSNAQMTLYAGKDSVQGQAGKGLLNKRYTLNEIY